MFSSKTLKTQPQNKKITVIMDLVFGIQVEFYGVKQVILLVDYDYKNGCKVTGAWNSFL